MPESGSELKSISIVTCNTGHELSTSGYGGLTSDWMEAKVDLTVKWVRRCFPRFATPK